MFLFLLLFLFLIQFFFGYLVLEIIKEKKKICEEIKFFILVVYYLVI
jgi:hypothetical protein